eukprot:466079-Prymnesium_polylepis.1
MEARRPHRQAHRVGLCRATPLGCYVAAERPAHVRERQPWQRQGVHVCGISGTRGGQASVGGRAPRTACLRHGPVAGNEQCRSLASGVMPANRAHACVDV